MYLDLTPKVFKAPLMSSSLEDRASDIALLSFTSLESEQILDIFSVTSPR